MKEDAPLLSLLRYVDRRFKDVDRLYSSRFRAIENSDRETRIAEQARAANRLALLAIAVTLVVSIPTLITVIVILIEHP